MKLDSGMPFSVCIKNCPLAMPIQAFIEKCSKVSVEEVDDSDDFREWYGERRHEIG